MLWREIALPPPLINRFTLLPARWGQRQNRRAGYFEQHPHYSKVGDEQDDATDQRPDEPPGETPSLPASYCKVIDEAEEQRQWNDDQHFCEHELCGFSPEEHQSRAVDDWNDDQMDQQRGQQNFSSGIARCDYCGPCANAPAHQRIQEEKYKSYADEGNEVVSRLAQKPVNTQNRPAPTFFQNLLDHG